MGETPLVRLQRMLPADSGSVVLCALAALADGVGVVQKSSKVNFNFA